MKKKNFLTIFAGYVRISPKLLWGLVFFAVILLLAVLAPVLSPYDPYYLSDDLLVAPLTGGHLLGTTYMGEDVLSMILYGGRTSLKIGIIAVPSAWCWVRWRASSAALPTSCSPRSPTSF